MAINPETQYPGKIAPSTPDYPYGAARNITVPGDGTGTPWESALVNDLFGFQQALLGEASIVPTGTPEKATASQYLSGFKKLFARHYMTLAQVKADDTLASVIGGYVRVATYTAGRVIDALYLVVADGTGTDDGFLFHDSDLEAAFQLQLIVDDMVTVFHAGAVGDGVAIDTAAVHAYRDALPGRPIRFPAGTFRGNFIFDNNAWVIGQGQNSTTFIADNTASPILSFGDTVTLERLYINGEGFTVDGETTATIGIRVGSPGGATDVTYGRYQNIEVKNCIDNIRLDQVVGVEFDNVYSHDASASCLDISVNDIVTVAYFKSCRFRQGKTGLNLLGGALTHFTLCVIESNKDLGLHFSRQTNSGARQAVFETCWFENNAHTPTTSLAGGMYINMIASLATAESPTYLQLNNCVISTAGVKADVTLNRGNQVEFKKCAFTALDSVRLVANTGTGYTFAKLIDCGTIDDSPNPTLYGSFPARVMSAGKYQGFAYEYDYNGETYKNYSDATKVITATATSLDVTGVSTIIADTSGGSFDINSLANGFDGQKITFIKTSALNTLTIKHNGAGTDPIFTGAAADVVLSSRQGYSIVHYQGTWYQAEA